MLKSKSLIERIADGDLLQDVRKSASENQLPIHGVLPYGLGFSNDDGSVTINYVFPKAMKQDDINKKYKAEAVQLLRDLETLLKQQTDFTATLNAGKLEIIVSYNYAPLSKKQVDHAKLKQTLEILKQQDLISEILVTITNIQNSNNNTHQEYFERRKSDKEDKISKTNDKISRLNKVNK